MTTNALFFCRVCGLVQVDYPWGADNQTSSFNICPCCGVEFGYEDSTLEGIRKKRDDWKKSGYRWFLNKRKPLDWDLHIQSKDIPKDYL